MLLRREADEEGLGREERQGRAVLRRVLLLVALLDASPALAAEDKALRRRAPTSRRQANLRLWLPRTSRAVCECALTVSPQHTLHHISRSSCAPCSLCARAASHPTRCATRHTRLHIIRLSSIIPVTASRPLEDDGKHPHALLGRVVVACRVVP